MAQAPTSKHRPEFARYIGEQLQLIPDGSPRRFQFSVPSRHDPKHEYTYLVNEDGTAPYCSCLDDNEWSWVRGCYLCDPAVAREMAERGIAESSGMPVSRAF